MDILEDMIQNRESSLVPVKLIQIALSLRIDHGSGYFQGILRSVQSTSIQDIGASLSVNQDFGHPIVVDVHDNDQDVIVWEMNRAGIFLREHDLLTQCHRGTG